MYKKYFKRLLDIVLSGLALIILSPVMLIIAFLVRINLGSSVIFKQKRPGKDEKIFVMYKFRSMTDEKDKTGKLLSDDERLTKFGKWLRSTSLDELPELWNIFKGDMSIIGPRPLLVKYLPYYTEEERYRFVVRPGLTGITQVNGRNMLQWNERLAMDAEYIKNISFLLDLSIVLKTVKKVIRREDVVIGNQILKDLDDERKEI